MKKEKQAFNMCLKKIPFRSKNAAKKYGNNFLRKYGTTLSNSDVYFRVYKCPLCNKYHLTKKKKSE